ncbi:hypothetical protein GC209_19715 [bacterium]|nr:hypothetical protein [bacterium]
MKITIVFATQRSGSTLLCQDIGSIGGLGRPHEHFLPIFQALRQPGPPPSGEDVLKTIVAAGQDPDDTGVFGVKIMLSYAETVCRLLGLEDTAADPLDTIAAWAQTNHEAAALLVLERGSVVDQALSRTHATRTGIWHRRKDGLTRGGQHEPGMDEEAFHRRTLAEMSAIVNERNRLARFCARQRESLCRIRYEDLAADPEVVQARIADYAEARGLHPRRSAVTRNLTKLIDAAMNAQQRADLRRYIDGLF